MKSNFGNRRPVVRGISILFVSGIFSASAQTTPAVHKLQPLNVKPGLWERTLTVRTTGELPIPAGMLERLTPEQRARFEERMKANSAAHANTTTEKECLTREDLDKQKLDFAASKECTPTVLTSNSTMAKGKLSCEAEGMKGTVTFEAEAPDSEHVRGSAHGTMTGNGHTMNVDDTFSAKWLGSNCGGVK